MRTSFYQVDTKVVLTKNTIKIIERKKDIFDYSLSKKIIGGTYNLYEADKSFRIGSEIFKANGKYYTLDSEVNFKEKDMTDILEERAFEREKYYSKRKSQILDLVNCNSFETFLTVTFEKDLNDSEIKNEWTKIKKRIERITGEKLQYICRIEKGHKGTERNHLHLIMNTPFLDNNSKYMTVKRKGQSVKIPNKNYNYEKIKSVVNNTRNNKELKEIRQKMLENGDSYLKVICACGHVKINKISTKKKLVSYVAKYITKDIEQMEKGKRIVWSTRGLEKPVQVVNEQLINYIKNVYLKEIKVKSGASYFFENDFLTTETFTYNLKDLYYEIKTYQDWFNTDTNLALMKLDKIYNMNSCHKINPLNHKVINKLFSEIPVHERKRIRYIDSLGGYKKYNEKIEKDKIKQKIKNMEVLQYEIKWCRLYYECRQTL